MAWVDLIHPIIHPLFYSFIEKIIPLKTILTDEIKIDIDGNPIIEKIREYWHRGSL